MVFFEGFVPKNVIFASCKFFSLFGFACFGKSCEIRICASLDVTGSSFFYHGIGSGFVGNDCFRQTLFSMVFGNLCIREICYVFKIVSTFSLFVFDCTSSASVNILGGSYASSAFSDFYSDVIVHSVGIHFVVLCVGGIELNNGFIGTGSGISFFGGLSFGEIVSCILACCAVAVFASDDALAYISAHNQFAGIDYSGNVCEVMFCGSKSSCFGHDFGGSVNFEGYAVNLFITSGESSFACGFIGAGCDFVVFVSHSAALIAVINELVVAVFVENVTLSNGKLGEAVGIFKTGENVFNIFCIDLLFAWLRCRWS